MFAFNSVGLQPGQKWVILLSLYNLGVLQRIVLTYGIKEYSWRIKGARLELQLKVFVYDNCINVFFSIFNRYVPWNLHEEVKGEFNFEGILDIV